MQEKNKENIRIIAVMPGLGLEKLIHAGDTLYTSDITKKTYYYRIKDLRNTCNNIFAVARILEDYNDTERAIEKNRSYDIKEYLQTEIEKVISNARVLDECENKTPNRLNIINSVENENFIRQVIVVPCNDLIINTIEKIGYKVDIVIPNIIHDVTNIQWYSNLVTETNSPDVAWMIYSSYINFIDTVKTMRAHKRDYKIYELLPSICVDIKYISNRIFNDVGLRLE